MNRKTIVAVLALPAVALIFLALSWIDGAVVRARLVRLDRELDTTLPLFTVAQRRVNAGLFASTVEVTYEFNTRVLQGITAAAASAKQTAYRVESPPHFTLRHHIQHGPIPGFGSLGLARIDTEIVIPDDVREKLRHSIGTDQPLKIVTLLGYTGGGTTTLDCPAFTYSATSNEGRIEWHGMNGRLHFSHGMNRQDGHVTLLGMHVTDNQGKEVTLGPVHFDYDLQRAFKVLYAGKASLTLDGLAITLPPQAATATIDMQKLDYMVDTSVSGDYLTTVARIGLGSLSAASFRARDVRYDFSLRHLHGPTYAALSEKMREIYFASLNGDPKAAQKILEPFREFGALLLEYQPEFIIDRISMTMPEGAAQLTGRVALPGFAHGDLDAGPMALMTRVDATLDVAIDDGFLNRNWGSPSPPAMAPATSAPGVDASGPSAPSRTQAMQAQLALLEQQGFVTRQGSKLSSHLEFRHGALTANGKPMGPRSATP